MIYCPKCGTANRRGSRFCNECGETLPLGTALRCPMCGTMNPVGNVYCDQCNARLTPMKVPPPGESEREQTPIKGLSLPTIPLEAEREQQVEGVTKRVEMEEEGENEIAGDWLAQLRASEEEEEGPDIIAESIEPVELPDWLRDMGPIDMEAQATPGKEQSAAEAPLEEEAPAVPPPTPAEIPGWLQEIAPSEAAPPEAAPTVIEPAPEEPAPDIPAPAEIPDWLQEIAPSEAAAPDAAPPPPPPFVGTPSPAVAEVPEWLREIAPEEESIPEAAPSVPPLVELPTEAESTETPEWLTEFQAEPTPPSAPAVPIFEGVTLLPPSEPGIGAAEEDLARAEIPDWLEALRPEAAEAATEEQPAETEGPLRGLRGVLPAAPTIEVPPVRESTLPAGVSEMSLARAQLLQSLLARPAEMPQPEVHRLGISIGERIQRWLVAAVLLVAVGGILISPLVGFNVPTLTQLTSSPAANGRIESQHLMNLYSAVQSTGAGDTVLVAFEYGPPEADELNLVAEPILRHLLDQGAHISVVSTRPEGLAMAAGLLSDIVSSEERYTLVNYRPGDATGVSQLLTDCEILPGGGTDGDTHHRLILVLTAQPGPLRWWIEQTRALGDAPPVVAGISTALAPAAYPYLDTSAGQLEGAISGLSGAATYEAYRGLGGRATQRINALAAGHAAVAGLMVLGAIIYAFGGVRGRKK